MACRRSTRNGVTLPFGIHRALGRAPATHGIRQCRRRPECGCNGRRGDVADVFQAGPPSASSFILRFVTVSGLVSLACVAISHVAADRLPGLLIVLMPTRVVNVDAMMFAAMILGMAATYRTHAWGAILVVGLIAGLLLNHQGLLSPRFEGLTSVALEPRLLTLAILLVGAGWLAAGAAWMTLTSRDGPRTSPLVRVAGDLAVIGIAAVALVPGIVRLPAPNRDGWLSRSHERRPFRHRVAS